MIPCRHCHKNFIITDEDRKFYETMEVTEPTWCPECRLMRKMAWCNEGALYTNQCDHCKKSLISYIKQDDPRKVVCLKCFFGDSYDPLQYGQTYDPTKSIFEQIHIIEQKIPHLYAAVDSVNENSEYIHRAGQAKNCYLIFHADFDENCMYGYGIKRSKDCVDNHYCHESELCYECIDVSKCHDMGFCQDCDNCASLRFCRNCAGCSDCFLCVGLRNKKFHLMNEEYAPEVYHKKVKEFNAGSWKMCGTAKKKLQELIHVGVFKHLNHLMNENCSGDHILSSQNALECFDCTGLQDCKYCYQVQFDVKNCYDLYQYGINHHHCYECTMTGINVANCRFCYTCNGDISDLDYCLDSSHSKNCFGCYGLKKHSYCILNTQYSKEDYSRLRSQIIEDMKKRGEWGEFFPVAYSVSAYNETIAQQWFPKTKEEVLAIGWKWQDHLPGTYGKETITSLPDDIRDATPDIAQGICKCETCSKNYKIIEQELAFLYKNSYPLPRECFDCRRQRRFKQRNGRTMRDVSCYECKKIIPTTYPEDFQGKICCEKCYQKLVY